MDLAGADLLLDAIAAGDALGVTADGEDPRVLLERLPSLDPWPQKATGGGRGDYGPGRTSGVTAQARCVQTAWLLAGRGFDGTALAQQLVIWESGMRRPIEPATRIAIGDLREGATWSHGGLRHWREAGPSPGAEPVVRAVLCAALARDDAEARAAAVQQCLLTQWSPDAVLASAALGWLLRAAIAGDEPWQGRWAAPCAAELLPWLLGRDEPAVAEWRREVGSALPAAADRLQALPEPRAWNPWAGRGTPGDPLRAVQLAAWAAATGDAPLDGGAPAEAAAAVTGLLGPEACARVALLGDAACANTACAAALLAAVHGRAPEFR